jgi:hypothetical protein
MLYNMLVLYSERMSALPNPQAGRPLPVLVTAAYLEVVSSLLHMKLNLPEMDIMK